MSNGSILNANSNHIQQRIAGSGKSMTFPRSPPPFCVQKL